MSYHQLSTTEIEPNIKSIVEKNISPAEDFMRMDAKEDGMVCHIIKITMLPKITEKKVERCLWYLIQEAIRFKRENVQCYWDGAVEHERYKDDSRSFCVKLWGDCRENTYRGIVI